MTKVSPTTVHPAFNRVLIKAVEPEGSLLVMPEGEVKPDADFVVVAIGPDVKCCQVGDSIILIPGANVLPLKNEVTDEMIALIHDTSIIAILK